MLKKLGTLWARLSATARAASHARTLQRRAINDSLWHSTLAALPFIQALPQADLARLRTLTSLFLESKEFSGAQGWQVDDAQAVMVAVQACLVVLHIAPPDRPDLALAHYNGFVGIVLHAGGVQARRIQVDAAGVVHHWQESLIGEAMQGGPLMLAWSDVAAAGSLAQGGNNVVVHEFVHVIDMQGGEPSGCPYMPAPAQRHWAEVMQREYAAFTDHLAQWERFGSLAGSQPLLSAYAATNMVEFFAVAAEAYFVSPGHFAAQHPQLKKLFDGFFKPTWTT